MMKKIMRQPFFTVSFVLINFLVSTSGFPGALPLEDAQKRIEADIRFLADDLLEGRGTPSRGLDAAAVYCAHQLKLAGWQAGNNGSFFQTYPVRSFSGAKATYTISLNGVILDKNDFIFMPVGMDPQGAPVKYNLEFAGFGIYAPDKGVDDYGTIDVKGKAVIAFLGAPWQISDSIFSYDRICGKMVQVAVHGGTCLVYVSEEFESPPGSPASDEVKFSRAMSGITGAIIPEFKGKPTWALSPVIIITPKVFNKTLAKVFGGTYEDTKKKLLEQKPIQYDSKAYIKVQMTAQTEEGKACNVAAMLQGSDPVLKNEWIVLTAHYDHLGSIEAPAGEDGIFNGANDNASGTAVILETARQLAAKQQLKRSILILLTSGEEMGTLGSAYYSKHPLVPYDRVIANINADSVGLLNDKLSCVATGSDQLFLKTDNICRQINLTAEQSTDPRFRWVYYIDSYHFARFNVPFIEFESDESPDYHRPTDDAGKIHFDKLPKVVIVVFYLLKELELKDQRPSFERPKWFLTPEE